MSKYIANPVEVDAFVIVDTNAWRSDRDRADSTQTVQTLWIKLEDGRMLDRSKLPLGEMTARMWPKVGDYLVIQSDGYQYLNPKEVFERKYRRVELDAHQGAAARSAGFMGK